MPPSLRAERTTTQKWKPSSCQTTKKSSGKRCAFTCPIMISDRKAKRRACPSPTISEASTEVGSPQAISDRVSLSPAAEEREINSISRSNSTEALAPPRDGPVSGLLMSYDQMLRGFCADAGGGLFGRDTERKTIREFLAKTAGKKLPGALYISGKPGVGKTALVKEEAEAYRRRCRKFVLMNSMSLCDGAKDLFDELLLAICPGAVEESMDAKSSLEKYFTAAHSGPSIGLTLLILDEMDALLERGQQRVLETIFSWAQTPGSRLVVVGIANALDLTHRFLPILHSTGCAPQLLSFTAYTEAQILSILRARIRAAYTDPGQDGARSADGGGASKFWFEDNALDLCARRVSVESGDVRKAMEACREALKKAGAAAGPCERAGEQRDVKVGIALMASTLSRLLVCGQTVKRLATLPLHQALLLCSMAMAAQEGRERESEESLFATYARVCRKQSLGPMSGAQRKQLLDALMDAGALTVSKSGGGKWRHACYSLAMKTEQTVAALRSVPLYDSVLRDDLRCSALAHC